MKLHIAGIIALVAVAIAAQTAAAGTIPTVTLAEGNSVLRFSPTTDLLHYDWEIGGRDYLQRQGFWYRIDGQPGGEMALHQLAAPTVFTTDTNDDGLDDYLRLTYVGNGLKVEVSYILIDGGARADLNESIRLTNTGASPLGVHFFQYTDFDLAGPGGKDTITIHGGNTATQTAGAAIMGETVDSPAPNHFQAGLDGAILALLNDSLPTTLDGTMGPLDGNAEWSFQWDFTLLPGVSIPITKDKTLVTPEPATLAFVVGGLGVTLVIRRKK